MATPFLCEIRIFSFSFAPKGWASCNGQLLPIQQNPALFSLVGTYFGGDGVTTFGLPNLQGRVPLHVGPGYVIGQPGGEADHTLTIPEMPAHAHTANASNSTANLSSPSGNVWGAAGASPYGPASAPSTMSASAIASTGASQPHDNMQPYLVLNFCIALQGIFPSQN